MMNVCCKDMYVKLYFRTLLYGLVNWQDCRFLVFFWAKCFPATWNCRTGCDSAVINPERTTVEHVETMDTEVLRELGICTS